MYVRHSLTALLSELAPGLRLPHCVQRLHVSFCVRRCQLYRIRTLFIYVKYTRTCQTPYNLLAREWPALAVSGKRAIVALRRSIFNCCLCKVHLLIDSTACELFCRKKKTSLTTINVINVMLFFRTVGIVSMSLPNHRISGEHYRKQQIKNSDLQKNRKTIFSRKSTGAIIFVRRLNAVMSMRVAHLAPLL